MTVTFEETDPATDILLDFIAGGVPDNLIGESKGNYNATFGDIEGSTYGDLSKKTLAQIYDMQDEMVATNKVSSATGRYQALKSTLEEYQNRENLSDNQLFTEKVQDDFGLRKMLDRGYDDWRVGDIDDDEFMHRLSCEWASLPDPFNGGKSHYDGDSAGNHASTTLVCFENALSAARDFIHEDDGDVPVGPPIMATDQGIRSIQGVLIATGDLQEGDVDGMWGPKSEAALRALIDRDAG